jgi:hypothetical protein
MADQDGFPMIAVTSNGALWLECFNDDPDAEHGVIICEIQAGSNWSELVAEVGRHIAEHGCGEAKP